jgi:hypothetical protein
VKSLKTPTKNLAVMTGLFVFALGGAAPVHAALVLNFSDVKAGGVTGFTSATSPVSGSTSSANWSTISGTGIQNNPATTLDLSTLDVTTGSACTPGSPCVLTVQLSGTGFTSVSGLVDFFSKMTANVTGGLSTDSVRFRTWFDQSNTGLTSGSLTLPGGVTLLADLTSSGPAFPTVQTDFLKSGVTTPFALLIEMDISATAANETYSLDGSVHGTVPEPVSILLLGSAVALALVPLRRKLIRS